MKLTDLELERVKHLDTRRALIASYGAAVENDARAVESEIKARLGIVGSFSIASDGSVTPVAAPTPEVPTPEVAPT